MSPSLRALALAGGLLAGAAFAQGVKPGVKNICVPSEDGRSWECGNSDNPPEPRPLPPDIVPPGQEVSAPPPFLAAPGTVYAPPTPAEPRRPPRPRPDEFPRVRERAPPEPVGATEPVAEAATMPAPDPDPVEAEPLEPSAVAAVPEETAEASGAAQGGAAEPLIEPAPEPVAPPTIAAQPESSSVPPPFLAAPPGRPLAAPLAETAPPEPDAPVQPESEATQTAAVESTAPVASDPVAAAPEPVESTVEVPAPAPAIPEPAARDAPESNATAVADASREPTRNPPDAIRRRLTGTVAFASPREFLSLPANRYSVQLASGRNVDEVAAAALIADISRNRNGNTVYPIRVAGRAGPELLLMWSDFPGVEAARAAIATLPAAARQIRTSARRIGPLQSEIRRAGSEDAVIAPWSGEIEYAERAQATGADRATTYIAAAPAEPPARNAPPSDFLALPYGSWTVQLARAGDTDGFDALLTRLGLSPGEAWTIAVDAGGARQWLLLWSQHPDADSARTAARSLRGATGAWPRKIGPLQDEARRAR